MASGPTIARTLKLRDNSVPPTTLNVDIPWPVDARLLKLVEIVNADDDFGNTTKRQLVAALIQAAEPDPLWLWERVVRYQRADVGAAAFWLPGDVDPITFDERKPGRPRV